MDYIRKTFINTKPAGQILGLFILAFMGFTVASGIAMVVTLVWDETFSYSQVEQVISSTFLFLVPAVVAAWLFYPNPKRTLRLNGGKDKWLLALLSVVFMALIMPCTQRIAEWNTGWHLPESMASVEEILRSITEMSEGLLTRWLNQPTLGALLVNLFVVALCPAVMEELFFRGCLQHMLAEWLKRPWLAILIAAVIFSLFHGDIFGFVPRFLLGCVLGFMFYSTNSIVPNICAHFFNNATVVVMYCLAANGVIDLEMAENTSIPAVVVIVTLVFAVGGFVLLYKITRKTEKEKASAGYSVVLEDGEDVQSKK